MLYIIQLIKLENDRPHGIVSNNVSKIIPIIFSLIVQLFVISQSFVKFITKSNVIKFSNFCHTHLLITKRYMRIFSN